MKNYLIVGGSSGIGKSLVELLADSGHQVYATYNKQAIDSTTNIHYAFLDVLEEKPSLDFLPDVIHGIAFCPGTINLKPFARIKPEVFMEDYNLQVVGAVKVIQTVLSKMKAVESASIVLFSSVAAQVGFNFHSLVSASKGAIEGLTKALAAELAPKIRVNAIAPSITDTALAAKLLSTEQKIEANAQRHALKRIGNPKDIAAMAAFLLSDNASWMTGQIMHVDGGMSSIK